MGMALASVPIPHGLKRENREAREFFYSRLVAGANTSEVQCSAAVA